MKQIKLPKCPNCAKKNIEEEILWSDVISMYWDDEGTYLRVKGECLGCGTEYEWVEHYEFSHCSELKERN